MLQRQFFPGFSCNKYFMDVHFRGWVSYAFGLMIIFLAIFMVLTRFCNQGRPADKLKDGNIVLLKFRALLLSIFPQASEKFVFALLCVALIVAFVPSKYITLLIFLETFTRYSPPRKASTERWTRRLREWWFSIPAAPVVLEREKEVKKKK
ncbi:hypothetical protein OIU77_008039 [Salix suchowensis]|uniref:ATP synthase F0 subunit 8 n=1 Tax=Salix suchowensis TaxID=1278906 RepID=A0ABQ9AJK9_9ROSI|nr:hypothetical protein OIU77_008039 [Salix suchowensis]